MIKVKVMYSSREFFLFAVTILVLLGCARTPDNLELENILTQEQKRKARLQAEEKLAVLELESIRQEIQAMYEAERIATPQELIEHSEYEPPEIAFLELSDAFYPLTKSTWQRPDIQRLVRERFPAATVGWRAKTATITILAGITEIDADKIERLTEEEFRKDLIRVGEQFNDYYRDHKKAEARVKLRKLKDMTFMDIRSKYLEEDVWYSDYRTIFFYRPDYRLSLMVHAKDDDLYKAWAELERALGQFRKRLADYFPAT